MEYMTLREYIDFIFKYEYKREFIWNSHHIEVCDILEEVILGNITRLIINIPVRYGKSEILKLFVSYGQTFYPDAQHIYTSYSGNLAMNFTYGIRNILASPHTKAINPNFALKHDAKAKGYFLTEDGGHCLGVGSGGTITGFGAGNLRPGYGGCIVIDDPIKPTEAQSEVTRDNINEWYNSTLQSRINTTDTPIILIMQRLHENDLTGFLLDDGSGEEWEHLSIPAINEDGSPLWAFKHKIEDLKRIEKSDSYMFSGQYMQRPAPLGGGIFKREWLRFVQPHQVPDFDYIFVTVDTASKTKTMNDYTTFAGFGVAGNNLFLIEMIRARMEAPEQLSYARNVYGRYAGMRTHFRGMFIEDKSNGTAIIQVLHHAGFFKVRDVQRNIDKVTRAVDTAPFMEQGRFYIVDDIDNLDITVHELEMFPNAQHDDTVDVIMDGVQISMLTEELEIGVYPGN
jgi:predicted phage terminase large subunit-like protein